MRVWGDVTYDGKPLDDGSIVFTPIDGTPGSSTGGPIKGGKYDVPARGGLVAGGKYKVEVAALRPVGKPLPNIMDPGGPPLQPSENYIPLKYNTRSTLTATISDVSSKNEISFQLQGGKPSGDK
jgi:hypothetical protein